MPMRDHGPVSRLVDRHLTPRLPPARFVGGITIVSIAGLLPVLVLYIALIPGFRAHLWAAEGALGALLRQVATNGLPVVFALNWLSFVLLAHLRAGTIGVGRIVALDFTARIGLFVLLHGLIYAGSALVFGSFGGEPARGLAVVAPTLVAAAAFGNLSGVYLYASLVGALPLHMAAIEAATRGRMPLLVVLFAAIALFALQALVLTTAAALLAGLR